MPSKDIIALPTYTFRLRLSQIILAILILILNIICLILLGGYGALGYGIFTPIATCIIVSYWYIASYRSPHNYNRWAILILDCFAVVWWLSMWSVLAQWSSALGYIDSIDNAYGIGDLGNVGVVHALTAIGAVLGAAEFVLFVVTLVSFSTHLHRARINERQNAGRNPFTNLAYETEGGATTSPGVVRPKGGFSEVA